MFSFLEFIAYLFPLFWLANIGWYFYAKRGHISRIDIWERQIKIKHTKSWLTRLTLHFLYWLYYIIDPFYNLIISSCYRFCKKEEQRTTICNGCIELLILLYLISGILFYTSSHAAFFVQLFFIWRIASITVSKLNELTFLKHNKSSMSSLPRTMILTLINFAEITIAYAFLYTSESCKLFASRSWAAIIKTLNIFTNWSIPHAEISACHTILIISQVFVFIVFILFFVTNIAGFKYQDR